MKRTAKHGREMELVQASAMFDALGQHTRLALLRLLVTTGPSGLPAGEIATRLSMPTSTVSFHLAALERSQLVQSARQSRHIIYSARVAAVQEMIGFLGHMCGKDMPPPTYDLPVPPPDADAELDGMVAAFNVLFLCTKNAARSLMAEAILSRIGGARFNAYSAGNSPADQPMGQVLDVLRKRGHTVEGLHSKSWDSFLRPDAPRMDFVIGLCYTLTSDFQGKFGARAVPALWPLPDPAHFNGTEVQMTQFVTQLYAGLSHRIEAFTSLPFSSLGRGALRARIDALTEDPLVQTTHAVRH
jgi:protein-tyrosine-phosphatase/DNA-binding transcriptional ArsR family regulator